MSHFGRKYYVQVAILTLPSKWENISGISMDFIRQWKKEEKNSSDLVKSLTIWRCGVMFNNAARIIQKNWREYYLLNRVRPYMHRFKLDNCPLTRQKILSDKNKVRLEISASRQFKPALHTKLNRLIRMYLAEDYDPYMTKRQKLWSEVKMVLNQELIARSNGENWVPVTPINLTEKQKKWCHRAHCYSGFYYSSVYIAEANAEIARLKALDKKRNDAARVIQSAWVQHWKKVQAEQEELMDLTPEQQQMLDYVWNATEEEEIANANKFYVGGWEQMQKDIAREQEEYDAELADLKNSGDYYPNH